MTMSRVAKKTGAFNVDQVVPTLGSASGDQLENMSKLMTDPPPPDVSIGEAVKAVVEAVIGLTPEADKMSLENIRGLITQECQALQALLLEKNSGYGNSVLDPIRIFSKATALEGAFVRIDDKLSRIKRGDLTKVPDEKFADIVDDLLGYLVLVKVALRLGLK